MERQQALTAVQQDWRRLGEMSQQYRSANVPIDCASCCQPSEVTVALRSCLLLISMEVYLIA